MLLAACQTSQVPSARSLGHLIGMLLQLCIIPFALKDTTHTHKHGHTQARRMPHSQVSKYSCQADYTAVATHRWRKRSALASTSPHAGTATRSTFRGIRANPRAPCGHTRTRMHAVAPAAGALSSYALSMARQLQLSLSTMLSMAHMLHTTRDTSAHNDRAKARCACAMSRVRMRTPAESSAHAPARKDRRMHAACS